MSGLSLVAVWITGLLGSVHCIGMCGGIVSAFSLTAGKARVFPVAVVAQHGTMATVAPLLDNALKALAYNAGRIGSYMAAGALAGGIAGGARALTGLPMLQMAAYWLANLLLVALGLYLMQVWTGLSRLEQAGQMLWRHLQPLTKFLLPLDSPFKMLALGALWGWLPCGMVYSMLLTAMLTGSAWSGAAVMLAFGLGTLPLLLTAGMLGARIRRWMQRRPVRLACGAIVLGFGLLGLLHATDGRPAGWLDTICVTPAAAEVRP